MKGVTVKVKVQQFKNCYDPRKCNEEKESNWQTHARNKDSIKDDTDYGVDKICYQKPSP